MDKKIIISLLLLLGLVGCAKKETPADVVIRINNYSITQEEFNQEFKDSYLGGFNTEEAKKDFLNNLIDRKLILQEAQRENLDKNKNFLKLIEKFWEQTLLKVALEKKNKELAATATVSDKTIEDAYNKLVKEGRTDKTYHQMYNQLKWDITKLKEAQGMSDWVSALRSRAKIEVSKDILQNTK